MVEQSFVSTALRTFATNPLGGLRLAPRSGRRAGQALQELKQLMLLVGGKAAQRRVICPQTRIELMYQSAFSRPPETKEIAEIARFVQSQAEAYGGSEEQVWTDVAHVHPIRRECSAFSAW